MKKVIGCWVLLFSWQICKYWFQFSRTFLRVAISKILKILTKSAVFYLAITYQVVKNWFRTWPFFTLIFRNRLFSYQLHIAEKFLKQILVSALKFIFLLQVFSMRRSCYCWCFQFDKKLFLFRDRSPFGLRNQLQLPIYLEKNAVKICVNFCFWWS